MKIRNGFVSNSSSSSFTCDVCGTNESGMDMSRSDAGMFECEHGHTCCDSHQLSFDLSVDDQRKKLLSKVEKSSYYKTRQNEKEKEIDEISKYSEQEVRDAYEDYEQDVGYAEQQCPICMFQVVDDQQVLHYLLYKTGLTKKTLLAELKEKFKNFEEFRTFVKDKISP